MHRYALLALTAGLLSSAFFTPAVKASSWEQVAKLAFSQPVQVPGKVLPVGTYTFKLMDSQSDRHIVQIWNADGTQLRGTFRTIPQYRDRDAADRGTVIQFAERPAGQPEAVKTWFYPGSLVGEEFIYSNR